MSLHETCVDFKDVERINGGSEYRTIVRAARKQILFDINHFSVRTEPDNVEWKFHIFHPETPFGFMIEDE